MATRRATLIARRDAHQAILDALYITMAEAASSIFQRMELDTDEGEQITQEKRIDRIQEAIYREERAIDEINKKLSRSGNFSLGHRRR